MTPADWHLFVRLLPAAAVVTAGLWALLVLSLAVLPG